MRKAAEEAAAERALLAEENKDDHDEMRALLMQQAQGEYKISSVEFKRSPDKGASVLCVPQASNYANGKNRDRFFFL